MNNPPTFRITQPLSEVRDRLRAELSYLIEDNDDLLYDDLLTSLVDTILITLSDLNDEDNLDPADED